MWERVDLPVLRFVAGCEYAAIWRFDKDGPTDEMPTLTALVEILRRLAGNVSEEEAKPLRRAAGSVARFGGRVVFDVAKSEVRRAGGDLAS
jgi:hypothetical protein